MSNSLSISIAMCTYNGERFLREQLESILAQSLVPDEIVICDDGSQDETVKLAKSILANCGIDVQIIRNPKNLGYKKNFEKAIGLCHGDIIFLSDQDDVWNADKIRIMTDTLMKENADLVFHDAELVDLQLHHLAPSFWETMRFDPRPFYHGEYSRLVIHNVVQGSACAFKKRIFERAYPFPEAAVHDEWLALTAAMTGKMIPVPKVLMKYRQGNNQIGALQKPVSEKVKRWIKEYSVKCSLHKADIERRISVISECEKRYRGENPLLECDFAKYLTFMDRRTRFINGKTWVIKRSDYFRFNRSIGRALDEMGKDFLAKVEGI